jgi:hypothetical protein
MLFRLRHLRFLPTPLALCLLDYALTLHGQPAAYWGGDSAAVSELSPETRRLLANGILASAAGLALWIAVVTGLLLLLPRPAALFVAVGVTVGHTVGATTWLWNWPAVGYQAQRTSFVWPGCCCAWFGHKPQSIVLPTKYQPAGLPLS